MKPIGDHVLSASDVCLVSVPAQAASFIPAYLVSASDTGGVVHVTMDCERSGTNHHYLPLDPERSRIHFSWPRVATNVTRDMVRTSLPFPVLVATCPDRSGGSGSEGWPMVCAMEYDWRRERANQTRATPQSLSIQMRDDPVVSSKFEIGAVEGLSVVPGFATTDEHLLPTVRPYGLIHAILELSRARFSHLFAELPAGPYDSLQTITVLGDRILRGLFFGQDGQVGMVVNPLDFQKKSSESSYSLVTTRPRIKFGRTHYLRILSVLDQMRQSA